MIARFQTLCLICCLLLGSCLSAPVPVSHVRVCPLQPPEARILCRVPNRTDSDLIVGVFEALACYDDYIETYAESWRRCAEAE